MLALTVAAALLFAASPERPKIAVTEFAAAGGADPTLASALTESVAIELTRRGLHEVITAKDIQTLLGIERQKQLMGCADDASSCMTELASALGAQFVLGGSLTQLGSTLQLNLNIVDTTTTRASGRATRLGRDAGELREAIPFIVAEVAGIPPPVQASKLVPYSLIGGGSAVLVGGALFGLIAYTSERELVAELASGESGAQLSFAHTYEERSRLIARNKSIGVGAAAVGAAMIGAGILLNLSQGAGAEGVALVPQASGVALVGVFR